MRGFINVHESDGTAVVRARDWTQLVAGYLPEFAGDTLTHHSRDTVAAALVPFIELIRANLPQRRQGPLKPIDSMRQR